MFTAKIKGSSLRLTVAKPVTEPLGGDVTFDPAHLYT